MENQQKTIDEAWKYYEHADNLFAGRINFFLVAESMVVVAYVTLQQNQVCLRSLIAILGQIYTGIWFYTNLSLATRMSFLTKEFLKSDEIIYKRYLDAFPKISGEGRLSKILKGTSSQWLLTYGLPIPTGIFWVFLLHDIPDLLKVVATLLWVLLPCLACRYLSKGTSSTTNTTK